MKLGHYVKFWQALKNFGQKGFRLFCDKRLPAIDITGATWYKKMQMDHTYTRPYFFDQGLHFECQRCGACCTGEPGFVFVDKRKIMQIAKYRSQEVSCFIDTFLYPFGSGYSISEHADGRCIFFQKGCTIYPVRPTQCRAFPFWFENLRSLKKWRRATRECPGIDKGPLYSKEQIMKLIHASIDDAVRAGASLNS